ncbi:MAG TPA: DNA-protecting protein DprA [Clostridiales bacterium]|nr:DNA-protecting protein DprA [Clostridiales bacterium]
MTDSLYWIWFQLMFGVGSRRAHAMMEYFSSPEEILRGIEQKTQVITMLREEELLSWERTLDKAREIKLRTLRKGCDIITPDHPSYPPLLHGIFSKPAVLYVKGELDCLRDTLVIAMVGTRTFTEYGRDVARMLAGELARCGAVVVSGLAKGIDTFCHQAAVQAGGKSIGILGCGIDVDYPKGSAPVKRALAENGAVVSEFPLGTEPAQWNFPLRNRLISGMSHGVVVVEADLKSGSMITAAHAVDQNRELFAVPGSIFKMGAEGCHHLIRDGAKLTQSVQDILEEFDCQKFPRLQPCANNPGLKGTANEDMGKKLAQSTQMPDPAPASGGGRRPLPEGCSKEAQQVYALVLETPVSFESIAANCPLEVSQIQSALTELEIYGLIRGYPGRRFSL